MITAWVVIPTYDEAGSLPLIVSAVRAAMNADDVRTVILVVDDNSPDGTGVIADRLAGAHADVRVLHRPHKFGLGRAYVAGFELALREGADYVLQMDADGSHHPADLPDLLAVAREGADLVLGSRYVRGGGVDGWARHRRLLSRVGGLYARIVLGCPVRDLTGGLKCFTAAALRAVDLGSVSTDGYAFQVETTFRAIRGGCRVSEVPITFRERVHGRSKMTLGIAVEALWRLPLLRLTLGTRGVFVRLHTSGIATQ